MKRNISIIIILLILFTSMALLFAKGTTADTDKHSSGLNGVNIAMIGSILDDKSRAGKEAKVGIEMAIHDFNNNSNQSFVLQLQFRNSQSKPWIAALAARDLIDKHQVNVILGPHTWGEVSSVAGIGSEAGVTTLSLADSAPERGTEKWPFLIQASASQNSQMKAVADIIQSRRLNKITFIYEITDSASGEITHYLTDALKEIGQNVAHTIALSPFASLPQVLERLKRDECKAFVLHSSLSMGVNLFENAKRMGMMKKGYVWIVTNTIMDHLHSVNASTISSMQGVLGIKSYFPESNEPKFQDFKRKFRMKFINEFPDEENYDPGVSAVQAYDATTAVALALNECNADFTARQLFDKISKVHFSGLSGEIQFFEGKLGMIPRVFQVISVIGNSNTAIWSYGNGFSESIAEETPTYSPSLRNFEHAFLPRRQLSTSSDPLKVLVPLGSLFEEFVKVTIDERNIATYTGFCIEVFKVVMNNSNLSYEFSPFDKDGSYDDLVKNISLGYDAVAGDVSILASRSKDADFTQPFTESGLEMIVKVQSRMPNRAWLFLKPFTNQMWVSILGITIYNGFVIWLIEREDEPKLREGSALYQVGTLLWMAFTTLFSVQGRKLKSSWTRMSMVVWLFVALIIIQSYTASLSSMLTTQSLEPSIKDIETLKRNNMKVGYCKASFVNSYLVTVLGFDNNNVINYPETDMYDDALRRGEIGAVFLEVPSAKLFLAKNCKGFIRAGETYKVGGYGFAFRKNYSELSRINEVLLNVSEYGIIKRLEDEFIVSEKCVDAGNDELASLHLNSFWVLFASTVGTSTVALLAYIIMRWCKLQENKIQELLPRVSARVSHAETPSASTITSNRSLQENRLYVKPPSRYSNKEFRHTR